MLSGRLGNLKRGSAIAGGFFQELPKEWQTPTTIQARATLHADLALITSALFDALTDDALSLRIAMTNQHS
jgi:hypothetical protein